MPLVKLTIHPEPVEVPEDEIPVLRAQGLVEDDAPAVKDPAPAGADKAKAETAGVKPGSKETEA